MENKLPDAISRKAIIETIRKSDEYYIANGRHDYNAGFGKAIYLISNAPALSNNDKELREENGRLKAIIQKASDCLYNGMPTGLVKEPWPLIKVMAEANKILNQ